MRKNEFYYFLFSELGFDEKVAEVVWNNERIILCGLEEIVE